MGVTFKGPPCSVSSISWVPSPKGSRASPKRLLPAGEQAIKTWAHGNISELNYNSLMWWSLAFPICTSQSEKFFAFTTWEMRFITLEWLTAGSTSPVLQPPCQWKRCNENPRGYMNGTIGTCSSLRGGVETSISEQQKKKSALREDTHFQAFFSIILLSLGRDLTSPNNFPFQPS